MASAKSIQHHKNMTRLIFVFIGIVFLFAVVTFITGAVDYYTNKGPCNERGGYYAAGQCVIGPVVVTP